MLTVHCDANEYYLFDRSCLSLSDHRYSLDLLFYLDSVSRLMHTAFGFTWAYMPISSTSNYCLKIVMIKWSAGKITRFSIKC